MNKNIHNYVKKKHHCTNESTDCHQFFYLVETILANCLGSAKTEDSYAAVCLPRHIQCSAHSGLKCPGVVLLPSVPDAPCSLCLTPCLSSVVCCCLRQLSALKGFTLTQINLVHRVMDSFTSGECCAQAEEEKCAQNAVRWYWKREKGFLSAFTYLGYSGFVDNPEDHLAELAPIALLFSKNKTEGDGHT
ncbi:uncharacterized protein PRD47_006030 [Ara ararauna]